MDSYIDKTYFHLPGIFQFTDMYRGLVTEVIKNPDILKDNAIISSIYGCEDVPWNGGRIMRGFSIDIAELKYIREFFNSQNIAIRFTFTNNQITPELLKNEKCNLLLELFSNGKNDIICNSELLENYIRKKYGNNFRYVSSTTKRLSNKEEQLKEFEKPYDFVVIDYDYTRDIEFLQQIKYPDKIEMLCNCVCNPHCPFRLAEYNMISKCQIDPELPFESFCKQEDHVYFWQVKKLKYFIPCEDINSIYLPLHIHNFKIEGRTSNPLDIIEILLYFLIKEKYKDEIRNKLQLIVW